MTVFERLAYSQPDALLALEKAGLLVIAEHTADLADGLAVRISGARLTMLRTWRALMRHGAWKRVRRRMRQVRCA